MRASVLVSLLPMLLSPALAQELGGSGERGLEDKIGQQLISLINFTVLPGISGARFEVSRSAPDPDYKLNKLSISGSQELEIEDWSHKLYVEGGLGYLRTDQNAFGATVADGDLLAVKTNRSVYTANLGAGPSIRFAKYFRFRPVLSVALSRFDNETGLGQVEDPSGSIADLLKLDWQLTAATVAGALQLRYDRLYKGRIIEVQGTYTHAYTNVVSAPSSRLRFSGQNDVFTLLARLSKSTGRRFFGRPVYWNVYSTATGLAGDGRDALGFSYFVELGAGLDLDFRVDQKPLFKALRTRASIIAGDNIRGFQVGLSFRF